MRTGLFLSARAMMDSGNCFVTIEGRLVESAKLDRNGFAVSATSWERGGSVITKTSDCAESTSKVVQMAIRDFVEHYRAMNPEKALK
jgi:hypothetical protein